MTAISETCVNGRDLKMATQKGTLVSLASKMPVYILRIMGVVQKTESEKRGTLVDIEDDEGILVRLLVCANTGIETPAKNTLICASGMWKVDEQLLAVVNVEFPNVADIEIHIGLRNLSDEGYRAAFATRLKPLKQTTGPDEFPLSTTSAATAAAAAAGSAPAIPTVPPPKATTAEHESSRKRPRDAEEEDEKKKKPMNPSELALSRCTTKLQKLVLNRIARAGKDGQTEAALCKSMMMTSEELMEELKPIEHNGHVYSENGRWFYFDS